MSIRKQSFVAPDALGAWSLLFPLLHTRTFSERAARCPLTGPQRSPQVAGEKPQEAFCAWGLCVSGSHTTARDGASPREVTATGCDGVYYLMLCYIQNKPTGLPAFQQSPLCQRSPQGPRSNDDMAVNMIFTTVVKAISAVFVGQDLFPLDDPKDWGRGAPPRISRLS